MSHQNHNSHFIPLFGRKGILGQALVSDSDYDWVVEKRWTMSSNGKGKFYVREGKVRHGRPLSVLIMERLYGRPLSSSELIDHVDGDTLNNTRDNLRIASYSQNSANSALKRNSSSGYKGVSWHKTMKAYEVRVAFKGVRVRIGYFDDPELAARSYDIAAIRIHGQYARTNFPRAEYADTI